MAMMLKMRDPSLSGIYLRDNMDKETNKIMWDSQGNIEPWGRDLWNDNPLVEFILIFGGATSVIWLPILILWILN